MWRATDGWVERRAALYLASSVVNTAYNAAKGTLFNRQRVGTFEIYFEINILRLIFHEINNCLKDMLLINI